jgi:hypothetical protein
MPLWPSIEQTINPAEGSKGRTMQVKGTSLIATEKFIRHQFGSEGYERFLQSLPQGSKALFSSTVLSPNWYPIEDAFYRPMQAVCDLFYGGKASGARDMGHFSALDALKGVYKVFARIASVDFVLKKTANIFATYYQPGKMEVAERGDRRIILRMTGIDLPHLLLEERICGYLEGALEVCGEREGRVMVAKSMASGDDCTDFVVRY